MADPAYSSAYDPPYDPSDVQKPDTLGFYEGPSSTIGSVDNWSTAVPTSTPFPPPSIHPPYPSGPAAAPPPPSAIPTGIPIFGPSLSALPNLDPSQLANAPIYSIAFWSSLFDVDTADVRNRILSAVMMQTPEYLAAKGYGYNRVPQGPQATEEVEDPERRSNKNADFYGPLWIGATLWLVLVVISHTMAAYHCTPGLQKKSCTQSWFAPVAMACSLIFSFELLVPAGLWLVMKWKEVPLPLMDIVCLYGYSFFIFIPTTMLWVLPWGWLRWLFALGAFLLSTGNILKNLLGAWQQHLDPQWLLGTVGGIAALQLIFTIFVQWKFAV